MMDLKKVGGWLDLTNQEFDILQCIYRLQLDGLEVSPKNIQGKYKRRMGKKIEKANLFKIIRQVRITIRIIAFIDYHNCGVDLCERFEHVAIS